MKNSIKMVGICLIVMLCSTVSFAKTSTSADKAPPVYTTAPNATMHNSTDGVYVQAANFNTIKDVALVATKVEVYASTQVMMPAGPDDPLVAVSNNGNGTVSKATAIIGTSKDGPPAKSFQNGNQFNTVTGATSLKQSNDGSGLQSQQLKE